MYIDYMILPIYQMPNQYIKQNCWQHKVLQNKSDVFLEIRSVSNTSSVRICTGTTIGNFTQFSMHQKLKKGDLCDTHEIQGKSRELHGLS